MGGAGARESSQSMSGGGFDRSYTRSGSENRNFGLNTSAGSSLTDTFIDPAQAGFLNQLRTMGMNFTDPAAARGAAFGAMRDTLPGMQAGFDNAVGLTDASGQIEAQSAALSTGLGNLFRNEINPAIRGDAIASGGFGGGRQGVAEGVATGQLADTYAEGVGDITARANAQAASAAALLPGLAQGIQGARMAPHMAGFQPLMQMAEILGGPTVLQRSRAQDRSRGESRGWGKTYNRQDSRGERWQQSQGDSSGWEFSVLDFL